MLTMSKSGEDHADVESKLCHVPAGKAKEIADIRTCSGAISYSLHELHPLNVPQGHSFVREDYSPVYHRVRRMPPRHNELTKV